MRSLSDFPLDDDSIGGVDRPEPRVRLTDVCITAWGMREDWLDTRDFREVVCGYTRDNSKACCIRLHARGRAADAAQITLGVLGQLGSATGGTSMSRTLVGMIHGRFQPFHNGHLDCLTWLAANADRMIVGITNPDWRDVSPVRHAPHRHLDSENPYPYHLREEMVRGAARDAGLEDRRLRVIPFFLNSPEVWSAYFTRDCAHHVTILSDWEEEKALRIEAEGYAVVRRRMARDMSATQVRRALDAGQPVDRLVPSATANIVRRRPRQGGQA